MAKSKRDKREARNYLTKRRTASAARRAFRKAAAKTMQVMGYTLVVYKGWLVKKYADGHIEKIEPIASPKETSHINLD